MNQDDGLWRRPSMQCNQARNAQALQRANDRHGQPRIQLAHPDSPALLLAAASVAARAGH